jgi:glycosyltransferase involved in cell wall biosynthesis
VTETAERLDRSRFDVYVCCLEDSPRFKALADRCHIGLFPVTSLYTLNGLRQIWRFRRYLARNDIRIVHTYMEKAAIFGVLAAAGQRHCRIITSRLNIGYWYTPFYRRFFGILNRLTTRILANSEGVKQVTEQEEHVNPAKIDVIYQGVDTLRNSPGPGDPGIAKTLGIPTGAEVVGLIANLRPVKDVELFLRAARHVSDVFPNVVFLVIGNGPMRQELGQLASQLGISDKVIFSDSRVTVPNALRLMSIGCLSSKSEGFSNAILEYMAAGLPVVATDVGGNREAILDGQTGYLVRERKPEAFAQAIIDLLRSPDLRASMGQQGMKRCRDMFDVGNTIRRLEDYYTSLIGPNLR